MTPLPTHVIVALAAAYLLGSIPTGLLVGKYYGIDVRKEGSGNIGATNLYRTLGRRVGIITLIGDCLKGMLPVFVGQWLGFSPEQVILIGVAAFCGHVFSLFLKFKGGKGVATALGVFLALAPSAVAGALAVFILMMWKWRYVSLASITAAAVLPCAVWYLNKNGFMTVATAVISLIVIMRHGGNIQRLLAGTENRFKG